jgi:hypothetical protein
MVAGQWGICEANVLYVPRHRHVDALAVQIVCAPLHQALANTAQADRRQTTTAAGRWRAFLPRVW